VPLNSTVGNFAYAIQGPGNNATARPLRLQLKASGDISVPVNILTISSAIGESGVQGLNKTGAGTLILSGRIRSPADSRTRRASCGRRADPLTPRHRPTPGPFPARRGEKQIPAACRTSKVQLGWAG